MTTFNLDPVRVDVTRDGWRELATDHAIVSPTLQARLALDYHALPALDPAAEWHWDAFTYEVREQRHMLELQGYTFRVSSTDPYETAGDMFADVRLNRRIVVLSTRSTGGHPILSDADNETFRGVHDILGHAASGRGFDRHGEEAAYARHALMFSELARPAMTTETRGQNAAMIHADGRFQAERIAVLPARWQLASALLPSRHEYRAASTDALERHASQVRLTGNVTRESVTS